MAKRLGNVKIGWLAMCVAVGAMALPAQAAFMVEAHSSGLANANFISPYSTPMNSIPSTAFATTAQHSVFGGQGDGPDTYIYRYTPGIDADNVTLPAGVDLGNGDLATGLAGGASGRYNVYITWPYSMGVNTTGCRITITSDEDDIVLDPVDMNFGGTGDPGGSNAWLLIGEHIMLTQGITYTVTQEANSTAYVSQRSHGVLWEKTGSLNAINLLSPNGGERLITDSWITVQWTSSPALAAHDVQIQASYDGGQVWQELAVMANAGGYEWRIPDARSNQCLIRISDVNDPNIADASDDTFLIYACDEPLRGDLNQDCFVNLLDWALMAQDWLRRPHVQPYEFPLDDDPQWTTQGQWAFGQPAGSGGAAYGHPDPASGFTGTQVYGVNLNGDYSTVAGGPYYLTAGPFNCRHYENMKLKFARWLNSDAPEFVTNMIDVSNDGSTWQRVWENTSAITDDHWQEVQYDISSVADDQENVYIRWGYQVNDRAYPYSGWNIDDVALWGNP